MYPEKIRVSIGTAAVLGMVECWLDVMPTTAYLMTYTEESCIANCTFCPQARESPSNKELLSRVLWPAFPTEKVLEGFENPRFDVLKRICLQAINYPSFINDVESLLRSIGAVSELPISLDSPPLDRSSMIRLRDAGLDRIGIPLDAATPRLFDLVKGKIVKSPYRWERHIKTLKTAVEVFGVNKVMSNLIVGIGETEKEAIRHIQTLMEMGVQTVLFAFTPIPGTVLADRSQPPLDVYRRVQLARHLITAGLTRYDEMEFDEEGKLLGFTNNLKEIFNELSTGEAFQTSGCPGCNRPYYNERPSGPFYNYPRKLSQEEIAREGRSLGLSWIS